MLGGQAQVAETTIKTGPRSRSAEPRELRLVVRRTRLTGSQAELWPDWRHHCLGHQPNRPRHRNRRPAHARVELAIKDLKDNGLAHCPSGNFFANGAWLACATLAHNLARWTARLGHTQHPKHLTIAATVRNRLLSLPGRCVNHSGRHILRLPLNWPWKHTFTTAHQHLHNLPLLI